MQSPEQPLPFNGEITGFVVSSVTQGKAAQCVKRSRTLFFSLFFPSLCNVIQLTQSWTRASLPEGYQAEGEASKLEWIPPFPWSAGLLSYCHVAPQLSYFQLTSTGSSNICYTSEIFSWCRALPTMIALPPNFLFSKPNGLNSLSLPLIPDLCSPHYSWGILQHICKKRTKAIMPFVGS